MDGRWGGGWRGSRWVVVVPWGRGWGKVAIVRCGLGFRRNDLSADHLVKMEYVMKQCRLIGSSCSRCTEGSCFHKIFVRLSIILL